MKKILIALTFLIFAAVNISGDFVPESKRWDEFFIQEGRDWSIRIFDRGRAAALYGVSRSKGSSPKDTAAKFLQKHHSLLGIENVRDLRLMKTEQTQAGTHYFYLQHYGSLPVVGAEVKLHVNRHNQIVAATSNYQKVNIESAEVRDFEKAHDVIRERLGINVHVVNRGLHVFSQGGDARLVWRLEVETEDVESWLLYVDAAHPNTILQASRTYAFADGEANIWAENPVVTPERAKQRLLYMDTTKAMSGRYARTYNANFKRGLLDTATPSITLSKFTTTKRPDRKFNFAEDDPRVTEAMAYYHINRANEHWRSVGFRQLDSRAPVFVNVVTGIGGAGWDNAQYMRTNQFPKTGAFLFGSGEKFQNFGLDGDVYYHEYGHGVLDRIVPGLLEARESVYPMSFHEAFSDMAACSITGNSRMGEFASFNKQTKKWEGRNLENKNRYPVHVTAPVIKIPEPHHTGLIAGGSWWDLQKQIGTRKAHLILYQSLPMLPAEMNFFDFRDAMIAADQALNSGTNKGPIQTAFAKHGISGRNTGQKGTLRFRGLIVAGGAPNQNLQIKSSFQRGDVIYLIAEYDGSRLSPGYNLVPTSFSFTTPGDSNVSAWPLISGLTNGSHRGLKGVHLYEVTTDSETKTGTYTFNLSGRLGGTNQTFPLSRASFTLN